MRVNVATFQPGSVIPFAGTHFMEHGLHMLEGKAVYPLNQDWVETADFHLAPLLKPQTCYGGGPGPFRYLLDKDVNRIMPMMEKGLR